MVIYCASRAALPLPAVARRIEVQEEPGAFLAEMVRGGVSAPAAACKSLGQPGFSLDFSPEAYVSVCNWKSMTKQCKLFLGSCA